MFLRDGMPRFPVPRIPAEISYRFSWSMHCPLTELELQAFYLVFSGLAEELRENPPPSVAFPVTIFVVDRDAFTLDCSDAPDTLGMTCWWIVLPVHRWRALNLPPHKIGTCIAEELCHVLWSTADEYAVELLAYACLRHAWPLPFEAFYNPRSS